MHKSLWTAEWRKDRRLACRLPRTLESNDVEYGDVVVTNSEQSAACQTVDNVLTGNDRLARAGLSLRSPMTTPQCEARLRSTRGAPIPLGGSRRPDEVQRSSK